MKRYFLEKQMPERGDKTIQKIDKRNHIKPPHPPPFSAKGAILCEKRPSPRNHLLPSGASTKTIVLLSK
ncbi:MAG: hypothetical protein LVR00_05675 [Rhabdochlamydiaceae bacterium]